jgi:hypothetical protein
MICSVVVENNSFEGRLHMLSPLVFTLGFPPRAVVSGFFVFYGIPQGGIANGLHGLNPRNTAHGTPPCKRRPALVWRLVNHKYTVVTRLVDKVNKLVIRTWGFLFHTFSLERVGYLCIHPW